MEKKKKLKTYGGLSEKQNANLGFDLPKVKGWNFNRKRDRLQYVAQRIRLMDEQGVKGNVVKYRDPQTKNPAMNKKRTSAGVIHLQPIAKGVALGLFDTGKLVNRSDYEYKYAPNIRVFNDRSLQTKGKPSGHVEARIARELATRRGQSSGGTYWNRTFRTWEKKYLKQGYSAADARAMANADPRNPVHYTKLERGSKEWLGAFNVLEQNIRAANKKPDKSITQGVGRLHKHDSNYLKKVLGVK